MHAAAHFAPDEREIADLLKRGEQVEDDTALPDPDADGSEPDVDAGERPAEDASDDLDVAALDEAIGVDDVLQENETAYGIAAE